MTKAPRGATRSMMKSLKPALLTILGLTVGGGLLWFSLRSVDFSEMSTLLRQANWFLAIPYFVVLMIFCAIRSARWGLLLTPVIRTKPLELLPSVVVGYAGAVLLPLQLGELVRSAAARRRLEVPLTAILASVAVERTFDLLFAAILLVIVLMTNPAIAPEIGWFAWVLGAVVASLFFFLHAFAVNPERLVAGVMRIPSLVAPHWSEVLKAKLLDGSRGAQALRSWNTLILTAVLTGLQLACICACVALSFWACGVEVRFGAVITVMVLATVGMTLPSAPGYVGAIQAAFVLGLAAYDVAPTDAIAASVFYHVLMCGILLFAGLASVPKIRPRAALPTTTASTD